MFFFNKMFDFHHVNWDRMFIISFQNYDPYPEASACWLKLKHSMQTDNWQTSASCFKNR